MSAIFWRAAVDCSAPPPARELRRPLGITIVGGLIMSQVLTLFTTPVVYSVSGSFRVFWCWLNIREKPTPELLPAAHARLNHEISMNTHWLNFQRCFSECADMSAF